MSCHKILHPYRSLSAAIWLVYADDQYSFSLASIVKVLFDIAGIAFFMRLPIGLGSARFAESALKAGQSSQGQQY
jgi:hypothetical protein